MTASVKINFEVNGTDTEVESPPMARLLDVLRENASLTGTKEGCGEGECGACSIMMNGKLVNACLVPALQAQGAKITTIEGLEQDGKLHPVQDAFVEKNGAQCGICTPGMVLAAVDLLEKNANPTLEEVKHHLGGNLCRCTGYMKIFDAVLLAAERQRNA